MVKTTCDLEKCSISLAISADDTTSSKPGYAYKINEDTAVAGGHLLNVSFLYVEPLTLGTLTTINLYQQKDGELLGSYLDSNNLAIYSYDYLLEKLENKNTLSYTYEFDENQVLIDIR